MKIFLMKICRIPPTLPDTKLVSLNFDDHHFLAVHCNNTLIQSSCGQTCWVSKFKQIQANSSIFKQIQAYSRKFKSFLPSAADRTAKKPLNRVNCLVDLPDVTDDMGFTKVEGRHLSADCQHLVCSSSLLRMTRPKSERIRLL